MRIGIDAKFASYLCGGLGVYNISIIKELAMIGLDEIIAFVPSNNPFKTVIPNLPNIKIHIEENLPNASNVEIRSHWEQVIIPKLLREYNIEIFFGTNYIIPLSWSGPSVVTVHDRIFELPLKYHGIPNNYYSIWARKCTENASSIITVSYYTETEIRANWNVDNIPINTIHLSHGLNFIPENTSISRNIIYNEIGINTPYLLHIGGWDPRKNLIKVLQSFGQLEKNIRDNLKLVVLCESTTISDILLEKYDISDQVLFIGHCDDKTLPHLYTAADMLIYPSLMEGFGLPPLEAIICGCPVITTEKGSIPEVVRDGAIYVNPEDASEITKAIKKILLNDSLRNNLIKKGKENIKDYSWEKTAIKTRHVLDQTLKNNNK